MDREKVIEIFDEAKEHVWRDDDEYTVGYNNGLEAGKNIALLLLKKQEPVEAGRDIARNRRCPKCFTILKGKFCHECGQAVKWE